MANTFNHNDKVVITDGGNVGIGTTNPQHQLNIAGATPTILLQGTGQTLAAGDVQGSLLFYNNDSSTAGGARVTGSVKQVAEDAYGRMSLVFGTSTTDAKAAFGDPGTYTDSTVERMRIDSSGNVGIGTTSPYAKLQVNGVLHVGSYSAAVTPSNGMLIETPSGTNAQLLMYVYGSSVFSVNSDGANANIGWGSSANRTVNFVNTGTGDIKVGIGTTSPLYKLDVSSGNSSNAFGLSLSGTERLKMYADNSDNFFEAKSGQNFRFTTTGGASFNILNGGNVGIGTTSPSAKLQIAGANNDTYGQLRVESTGAGADAQITFGTPLNGRGMYVDDSDSNKLKFYTGYGKGSSGKEVTFDNEGNVGIGTTNPSEILHVKSSGSVGAVWYSVFLGQNSTGYQNALNVRVQDQITDLAADVLGTNYGSNLTLSTRPNGGAITERVRITPTGNVGIGTTSPSYKLDVDSGSVVIAANFNNTGTTATQVNIGDSGNSQYSNLFLSSNSGQGELFKAGTGYTSYGGALSLNIYNSNGAIAFHPNNTANAMFIATNGNVGIGTTSPDSKFHVEDTNPEVRITGTGGTSFPRLLWEYPVSATQASRWALTGGASANVFYLYNYTQSKKVFQVDGTASHITLNHDAAGTTQIGTSTTQTAYQLYVKTNVGQTGAIEASGAVKITSGALGVNIAASATAGRIDASNDIVAYSTSDYRLKENIKPLENATEKVKKLTGVEFDWKQEHKAVHGYEGHDVGVIAQEVQEVLPEAIRTNDSGYLSVRYEKLIGLLIESNKELAARVEELEQKLKQ